MWWQIIKNYSGGWTSWMVMGPNHSAVLAAQPKSCCRKASIPILFTHSITTRTRKSALTEGKSFSLLCVCHVPPEAMQEKQGGRSGWASWVTHSPSHGDQEPVKFLAIRGQSALVILLLSWTSITEVCAANREKRQIFSRSFSSPRD